MLNSCGGDVIRVTARNTFSDTITAGTPFVIDPALTKEQLAQYVPGVRSGVTGSNNVDSSKETNIIILNAGIFSNFADGLVFGSQYVRPSIFVEGAVFAPWDGGDAGTLTGTAGSTTVTGAGTDFTLGTAPVGGGDIVMVGPAAQRKFVGFINSVPGPATLELTDGSPVDFSGDAYNIMQPTSLQYRHVVKDIPQLNCMHPWGRTILRIEPDVFSGDTFGIFITARLKTSPDINFAGDPDLTLLTDSVNSAFDGSTVTFDIVLDLLVTPAFPEP